MEIVETLKRVREKINRAAVQSGRSSDNIKLVAVSKTVSLEIICEAVQAGVSVLGENRVQEARDKIVKFRELFPEAKTEWHFIGGLQKNKAKTAVQLFDLIHSVDSPALAEVLDNYALQEGKQQRVLVQVKLSEEPEKHGVVREDVMKLLEKVNGLNHLKLEGLMTMPPYFDEPEKTRPYFAMLRKVSEDAMNRGYPVKELSMGMSHDFEIAIQEGATIVRIGTAIFGERSS
ncbi:YggS family pyridoxal phosphate-dependent enzyme [bacterium]|nr:MAG: YggS family pyridoxal phosphate-dependent enzyme [bacterium]